VVVVSHDRYFLNRVCTAILGFEGDGVLRYGVGNYDYHLEKRSAEGKVATIEPVKSGAAQTTAAKPRKLKWKEERELEGMEAAILAAENEVARIETLFAEPDFYVTHATDYGKFEVELRDARDHVARLYARWADLGELAGTS
jgi:ATP-binding cassette subfamily F protein uup